MPKIGSINLLYEGDNLIKHEIYYSQTHKFQIKGLSNEFYGLTGFIAHGYETEKKLTDEVEKACIKYRELKTKSRIVILYKCSASAELRMNKVSEGEYVGLAEGVSNKISDSGYNSDLAVFGIDYTIAQVIDDGVRKKYYKVDKTTREVSRFEIKDVRDFQEMEHSVERELFFENLIESMKKMVVSASKFFGADPKEATLFIERNNQKLL